MRTDDWLDQAPRRWMPGSWAATSLRLAAELGIDADLVHLHRQYSATLAIEPEAERKQAQAALARNWDRCARTALERRDTLQWRDAIASDGRMTAFALLCSAGSAQVSFPCKRIWELEDYLRNEDAYARRQQTLLRYGGQQLRVSRGRWLKLPREQRLCQLCNQPGAVEDERHMVMHCPLYSVERERFRKQLRAYSVHAQWAALDLSEETLFGLAMGVRPTSMIQSSVKHRKVAMSYCRHFLTTALRRRERLLASLPKPRRKKAKPEGADRSRSALAVVTEPAGAAVAEQGTYAVLIAESDDSNPELAHDHESDLLADVDVVHLVDGDRADEPDGESDDEAACH
jgi:hypothetical protein